MDKWQHAAWFAAGIGLGIASTWLIATPRGRRARRNAARQVSRMADQGREEVQKATRRARDRGMEMMGSGREFVRETGADLGRRLRFATK